MKNGTSDLILTAENTFSGGTTVNAGTLNLAEADLSQDAQGALRGTVTVNAPGTLRLSTGNALGWGAGEKVDTLNVVGGLVDNVATGDNGWGITINLTGGTLRSNGGTSSNTAGQLFSLGGGSAINVLAAAAPSVIAGRINLREGNSGNVLTLTVADGAANPDLEVSAAITQSATYGITKTGPGTMVLTTAAQNGYTGLTTIDGGILGVGGTVGDGTIRGNVTVNSGGTLRLDAGNRIINSSLITLNGTGSLNTNSQTDAIGALAGNGTISGGNTLVLDMVSGTQPTFSGTITNTSLTARGENDDGTSSKQVFSGSLTGGNLQVQRGNSANDVVVLELAGSGSSTSLGSITLGQAGAGAAVLNIKDNHTVSTGNFFLGEQSGHGGTVNQSGGTVTVTGASGNIGDGNGSFRIAHWPSETSNYNLSGGTLNVTNDLSVGWDGTGTFTQTGGTANVGRLVVNDGNSMDTTGSGTFTLNGGTFQIAGIGGVGIGSAGGTANINLGGGTLRATGSWSSAMNMTLTSAVGPAIIDTNGNSINLSGNLTGSGGLNKNTGGGTLTLGGTNNYGGATTVNAGTLAVTGSIASATTVNNTATLSGNGGVTGTVTVTSGGTLASNGTITGNVSAAAGSTVTPAGTGRVGTLTINGTLTAAGGLTFDVNSAWTTAGSDYDQVVVSGAVNLTGATLTFNNTNNASAPTANSVLTLIDQTGGGTSTAGTSPAEGATVTIGSAPRRAASGCSTRAARETTWCWSRATQPATVYVSPTWAGFVNGRQIADGDLGTTVSEVGGLRRERLCHDRRRPDRRHRLGQHHRERGLVRVSPSRVPTRRR